MKALIQRNDAQLSISFTPDAYTMRLEALGAAAAITGVQDATSQEKAVLAQSRLQSVLKAVESARAECKAPIIAFGRAIDTAAKDFRAKLEAEILRVSRLIGDFQTLEQAKTKAAEAATKLQLTDLERERQEALAQAQSHDELDAINDEFNRQARAVSGQIPKPVRANNQAVRKNWEIIKINEFQLCRARPDLVRKIEFDMRRLKEELSNDVKLPGVEAREIVTSSVITKHETIIEV